MLHWVWPSDPATACPTTLESTPPLPQRYREPKPFAGFTTKPHCDACTHVSAPRLTCYFSPTTTHRQDVRTPSSDRHRAPFMPQSGLGLSGLGGLGQSLRQRPSHWGPLAPTAVRCLSPLVSRDPRYALLWEAYLRRAHRARARALGRRLGHPGDGTGVRGRPRYGASLVGRGSRPAPSLFATRPLDHHKATRSCWSFSVSRLLIKSSRSTPVKHLLLMEQQVWSRCARQSTLRLRVAAIN
jgi:hypothetical protein